MPEGSTPADLLAAMKSAQEAFWSASLHQPAFASADAFAPPDWQVFDSLSDQILAVVSGEDGAIRRLRAAGAAYRDVVDETWARVRQAFEVHRRAVHVSGTLPDWRVLRDRWFDLAEAEFIRTLRSPAFLDAQCQVIRTLAEVWCELPDPVRSTVRAHREAARTAQRSLEDLGVGLVEIAATPKEVIWRSGRVTLSRYLPLGVRQDDVSPVLICHGLIGRQTMTDLRPDRSLVRNLLAAGVDVFVLDWGSAGPEDSNLGMDHFVGRIIPEAIGAACTTADRPALTLFGICQGGTMAACHAARAPGMLDGLILAVAPVDFSADIHDADPAHGLLHVWLRALEDTDIEALIDMEGNLSGEVMGMVFNQLNPVRTLAKYSIEMLESTGDPAALTMFLAMEKWLADRPDLPGAMARTWLIDLYRKNALVAGKLEIDGEAVDLGRIAVPVLNIFATGDHIIPPPCSRALGQILTGRSYQELALPTGHIGAFVSARAQTLLAPSIVSWLHTKT